MAEVVADAAAVVEAALAQTGRSRAHVVGHDWGAIVAWTLAGSRPELVHTVTGISAPPLGRVADALRRPRPVPSRRGTWRPSPCPGSSSGSSPCRPELVVTGAGPVLVASGQTRELAERDAARLADPAALTAALNWYRAIPLRQRAVPTAPRPRRCSCGATATPP